jgi:glyoxylase-like metal-dependent hydrolase (beta-lactamase superfamily II)
MRVAQLCAAALLLEAAAHAQPTAVELDVLPVQGNVYMLHAGDAGNIAFQVGSDGVFVVNALRADLAERIAAKIKEITPAPIRYIVSPNADVANTSGNGPLAALGMFGATASSGRPGATLVAHENVLLRLSNLTRSERNPFPGDSVPFDNYLLPYKDVYFNGEPIFIMHQPNAHTDGDSLVLFRKSDTIYAGDLFVPDEYPVIDVARGGSVDGLLKALHNILDLAVPARLQDGGTRVIPGRGRLCNEADVVEYRDMVAIVRDRVRALLEEGKTLQQIQAARPTLDYDASYGSGEAFVRSVYESLRAAR